MRITGALAAVLMLSTASAFAENNPADASTTESSLKQLCNNYYDRTILAPFKNDTKTPPDVLPIKVAEAETEAILGCITYTRRKFFAQAGDERTEQTIFDSSILTLITGAIGAAFFHADVDAIGALGLAAGSASNFRGYYDPHGAATNFATGSQALQCVEDESTVISLQSPSRLAILRRHLREMKYKLIEKLQSESQPAADVTAAKEAIAAADAAIVALTNEIAAYVHGPATLSRSLNKATYYVMMHNSHDYVNISSAQQSIKDGIAVATQAAVVNADAENKLQSALGKAAIVNATPNKPTDATDLTASVKDQSSAAAPPSSGDQSSAPSNSTPAVPPAAATSANGSEQVNAAAKAASSDQTRQNVDNATKNENLSGRIALLNVLSQMANDEIADRPYTGIAAKVAGCTAALGN